ncbi:23S rRNA (uracil(1939)-C(5))-methyltransferase RlmD [Thermoleptolyngbya sp. M55_K2018_002]|uniref:23S rRNA (uracil(1939)-C(5))-methyltransferase RlmD n=1 Tax=Thermoleptolyngbya sp. M55_K2018_002 TaxID=2747808 RepID=UPI0019DB3B88|nr:23S rRNA (uracil(1939)-C(5))-methyltransferase RlmD [Thermoleptolyngbya sp. M55_K2018_002]HIK43012.1 23S rRNA (uracil(1939)-C(5))-methyltransferase RlmD [Thermoleptolyngbya sp. M55_K2018_002]
MPDPLAQPAQPNTPSRWRQGELVELTITDLSNSGDGVGRVDGRVVFVPDTAVGDRLIARLIRVKPQFAQGKLHELLEPSGDRIRPACIVADKCGGCQWQHLSYAAQLVAKQNLVTQDLERIGGFANPPVSPILPLSPSPALSLNYRNKATYPLDRGESGQVRAGYYQKGSHQLVNLNQCPIQDARLNPLLAEVKQDIQTRGWSIYDERLHRGKLRHLGLRIGRHTGEMLLTLVSAEAGLVGLVEQAEEWLQRYPDLVGVALNLNPAQTNVIFGPEMRCIAGRSYLREIFAGLEFQIQPTTFFQVNTEQAEALLGAIASELNLQGDEILVDAYCGIGTFTLPLARQVKRAIGIELHPESIQQAWTNAYQNNIANAMFQAGTVEELLPKLDEQPDVVLLDPPRKGCDALVLETLLSQLPRRIAYVSCNPATLARDLKRLSADGTYRLTRAQPVDFFPQTPHVECVAFLEKL